MSLSKKTDVWVAQQIITPQQRKQILAFESQRSNRTFWNTAFMIAGSLIGLGLCLLIAANWKILPAWLKLAGDFALFGGFIYGLYDATQKKRNGWKELFAILCFLMVGGTIGLISQIFHLNGGWHNFACGWALLSLPFILLTRSSFFNITWLILLFSVIPFERFEKYIEVFFDELTLLQSILLLSLYGLYVAGEWLHEKIATYTALSKNVARLCLWSAYYLVFYIGGYWGLYHKTLSSQLYAHIIVFGFFALRMYTALREGNIGPFKRNAILAEAYIFLIFMSHMGVLWTTGLTFILGGLLILLFVYVLRRTLRYIKSMEHFQ